MSAENTYLIVGLGNPGQKYHNTRHNVGFMVVDHLAGLNSVAVDSVKWSAYFCKTRIAGKNVFFIKPDTYMNLSGQAVVKFLNYYDCPIENLLVIHDDLDMHPGRLKLACKGGAGGHNGIKSIIQSTGSKDFCRLKFGIGRPGQGDVHADFPVDKFVLSSFTNAEASLIDERLRVIEEGIECYLTQGPTKAMTLLNAVK